MSLIEEALRRIQDPILTKHASGVQAPPRPTPASEPPPIAHSWPTTPPFPALPASPPSVNPLLAVSFSVLALTSVIVIGGAFWIGHQMVMRPTPIVITEPLKPRAQVIPAAPEPPQQPETLARVLSVLPAPAPKAAAANLVISGIVEGMGESYAVINGLIVGAGERVGDATVLEVANGAVKLRRKNGEDVVLSVPR